MVYEPIRNSDHANWRLQELEALISELEQLLPTIPDACDNNNLSRELDVLERWREYYHQDCITLRAFSQNSMLLLTTIYDRMKVSCERQPHMAEEASGEQVPSDRLVQVVQRMDRILHRDAGGSY